MLSCTAHAQLDGSTPRDFAYQALHINIVGMFHLWGQRSKCTRVCSCNTFNWLAKQLVKNHLYFNFLGYDIAVQDEQLHTQEAV